VEFFSTFQNICFGNYSPILAVTKADCQQSLERLYDDSHLLAVITRFCDLTSLSKHSWFFIPNYSVHDMPNYIRDFLLLRLLSFVFICAKQTIQAMLKHCPVTPSIELWEDGKKIDVIEANLSSPLSAIRDQIATLLKANVRIYAQGGAPLSEIQLTKRTLEQTVKENKLFIKII